MEDARLEELISGYALGILDEDEHRQAELLLQTNSDARTLLADLEEVTAGLALSVEPVDLPAGHLERFRRKAGALQPEQSSLPPAMLEPLTSASTFSETIGPAPAPQAASVPAPLDFNQRAAGRAGRNRPNLGRNSALAYAAALVFFVSAAAFGLMWLNAQNQLSSTERNNRELAQLLASPNLKVTELKPVEGAVQGTMRLYTDPASDKAYLVAQNLAALPGDKEYEAWLITGDNQARKAGLLGAGGNRDGPLVYELETNGEIEQYKLVAITIERKGGVDKSDQKPILAGSLA